MWKYILIALLSLCGTVRGYGSGAPLSGCENMTPGHIGNSAQTGSSPYTIHISANQYACEGEEIQVTINGSSSLQGFLCQPRTDPSVFNTTGSLTTSGTTVAHNTCGSTKAALTHNSMADKESISLVWTSSSATDNVYIVCTIATQKATYWVKQTSNVISYTSGRNCTDTGSGSASTFSMTSSLYAICILLLGIYFISMTN